MDLNILADANHWESKKDVLYGEQCGFLLTLTQNAVYISAFIVLSGIDNDQKHRIIENLNSRKNELKTTFSFDNSVLFFRFAVTEPDETVKKTLNEVLTYLHDNVKLNKACVYCGKEYPDSFVYKNNIKFLSHSACIPQASESGTLEEYRNPHYFLGAVGALIGGLIGVIPWAFISTMEVFAAILAFLVGLTAFYGYRRFGGKLSLAGFFIVLMAVVISLFVGEVINLAINFYYANVPFTLNYLLGNIEYNGLGGPIIGNLSLGLFVGILGVFGLLRKFH